MQKKKTFKGRLSYINNFNQPLWKGVYAGIAFESARITEGQIKAASFALKRVLRKEGDFWIRLHTNIPVTKKAVKVRMGKGKGSVDHSIVRVRPGTILFEIYCKVSPFNVSSNKSSMAPLGAKKGEILAKRAYRVASSKLPLHTRFVKVS